MSVNKAVLMAVSFFLFIVLVLPASAIFERDLPLLTVSGARTSGVMEVENDTDSRYRQDDIKLTITARGLVPRGLYTVWLIERKDGGATRGLGVADYSFTADGAGTGRFISTMHEYDFAYWDILEIRHHPDGNAENSALSVVVLRAELWRAHPY